MQLLEKKKIMDAAKDSFISSTFWSERIGFAAAIKTIQIMKKKKHWLIIRKNGKYLRDQLEILLNKNKLNYEISEFLPIITISLKQNNQIFKSFLAKEMLKKRILSTNIFYINIFHTKKIVDNFLKNFDKILKKYKNLKKKNYSWVGKNFYINRTKD